MGIRGHVLIFASIFLGLILHVHCHENIDKAKVPSSGAPHKLQNLLTRVCKKSNDFKFCLHTLKSCPQTSSATDITSLANVALEIARNETANTREFFIGVLNKEHTNLALKSSLTLCVNYFNTAAGFFSLNGLKGGTAQLDVSYALDNAQNCQEILAGSNVHIKSIQARIQHWKNFYSIAYAAVVAVEKSIHPLPQHDSSKAKTTVSSLNVSSKVLTLLTGVCKKSNDFKFCLQTLKSCPQMSSVTDTTGVVDVSLELARKETMKMREFFIGVLNEKNTNLAFKPSLTLCSNYFNVAAGFFSLNGLKGGTARLDVSYALDNAQNCQDILAEKKVDIESIQARIQNWKKFYSIAYAAIVSVENSIQPLPVHVLSQAQTTLPSLSVTVKPLNLLTEACKNSNNCTFCLQTLKSLPGISSATDITSVADIALKTARKETTNVRDFFVGVLNSKYTKPEFKPSLKLCIDYFNAAVGCFKLNGLQGGTALLDVSYALNNANSCQHNLEESNIHIESVGEKIQSWKNFYSIAYAAVAAVENTTHPLPKPNK